MNEERRKADRRVPPAVAQHAIEERAELLARIEEQAREIERLRLNIADYNEHERCYQAEIANLKAQPSGAAVTGMADALRHVIKELDGETPEDIDYAQVSGALGVYALFGPNLNSPIVSAGDPLPYWEQCNPGCDPEFNGQRSKECAQLCHNARAALTAQPDHSAQSKVPDGYVLVPAEPTAAMLEAGYFTDHAANRGVYKAMLAAAPAPGKEIE